MRRVGLWFLPAVLLAAACGDERTPSKCEGVVCGAHASCNETTGECACENGFSGDATAGCTENVSCTVDSCNGHGTCSAANGNLLCTCDAGWTGERCDACATGYVLENGGCINEKQVPCLPPETLPAHAHSVDAQVTVTYADGAWSTAATCATACDEDYVAEGEAGACINEKQVSCVAPTTLPANAHSVSAQVTVTYADGAWSTAATCATACNANYVAEGEAGACINSKQVACTTPTTLPDNAHSVAAQVTVTYSGTSWSTPATCATACNDNYVAEGTAGACINSKQVDCVTPTNLPANAHAVVEPVTVTYSGTTWSTPATCAFACNAGYTGDTCAECAAGYASVDGTCVTDGCAADPCANGGVCSNASGSFTCGCVSPFGGATCEECADGFVALAVSPLDCVQNLCTETTCGGHGTCSMATATTTECACASGYVFENDSCINSKMVACVDAAPANATSTVVDVEVTWNGTAWNTAADCAWTCAAGYHASAGACVADADILWCNVWPDTFTGVAGDSEAFNGLVRTALTASTQGQTPGIDGMFCYSAAPITATTPVSELTCVDASFLRETTDANLDDEYQAIVDFAQAGSFNYVFAFSGDGKASWTLCNTSADVNGVATLTGPQGSLIFSEYVEGANSDKAIEVFNATGAPKDVTGCTIELYTNGSATAGSTFTFPDDLVLPANGTYAICNSSAIQGLKDRCNGITHGVANFNGNDALVLKCGGEVLDAFGQVGVNPGTAGWGTAPVTTTDHTLRRVCSVRFGDLITNDAFDPAAQWESFEVGTIDGIGEHCPAATDACNPDPCNGHGTCSVTATGFSCACSTGYDGDTCADCATDYVLEAGACINTKQVDCATPTNVPTNAHAVVVPVTVTYSGNNWSAPSACAFECNTGYTGDACDTCAAGYALVGTVCAPNACAANPCQNGGSCSVTATGFSCACATGYAGDTCADCATDYVLEAGACINTKQVDCATPTNVPTNAHAVVVPVTVTYSGTSWSTPATCDVACDANYVAEGTAGACINTKQVDCATPTNVPTNAHAVVVPVTVTYSGTTWSTPATCDIACDTDYVAEGIAGACIHEKQVDCATPSGLPANAHAVIVPVTVTYSGTSWSAPSACAIACNTGYTGETCAACADGYELAGEVCVVSNCAADTCANGGTCANGSGGFTCDCVEPFGGTTCEECASGFVAMSQSPLTCVADLCIGQTCGGHGTCSMATATEYACACDSGYTFEGGSCIDTKMVACIDTAPANATSTAAQVEVTWNGTTWSTAADCAWTCNTAAGFGPVGADQCLHEQTVACTSITAPANASMVASNVTITFDGTNWSTPANCAWTCDSGYHLSGSACVANVNIGWCNVQFPKDLTGPVGIDQDIYGQFYAPVTEATTGQVPGVVAKFCYGAGPIAADLTDLSSLTCVDAEFNVESGNNDEYGAIVEFGNAGTFQYVYAFSGDGQQTWKICDADDTATWAPGTATILAPFDVVGATATSSTAVEVTFNRAVKADTVLVGGTQFEVYTSDLSSQLNVSGASVSGSVVTLTTDAQASGTEYTVVVANTVKDVALETGVPASAEATFVGYSASVACSPGVVISQFYAHGGAAGSLFNNDFVELHNRGSVPVDLSAYSVQYASATGGFSAGLPLVGTIEPGRYYLIQGGRETVLEATPLPTADITWGTNMGGKGGKVALVLGSTAATGCADTAVVDLIGYGTAGCSEGTKASAPTATNALGRAGDGCTDTNDNATDFSLVAPDPRNSSTAAAAACVCQ